jgi:hypothetical protein
MPLSLGKMRLLTTTQEYLHTLPDADAKNLTALDRIRGSRPGSRPEPAG